jgi:hypothetical protein
MKPSPATPTLAGWPALLGALLLGCTTQTSPDTSNKPDSGAPVSDAASDEGPIDAPVDVFIGCDPASVAAFQPPAYVPAVAHQDVCSSSDVAEFLASCVTGLGNQTCAEWAQANVASNGGAGTPCGNCLAPRENGGAVWYDPLGQDWPNYAGCIELTDPVHGKACARAYANANACKTTACDHVCRSTTAECSGTCNDCYDDSLEAGCGPYDTAEQAACATDFADGGAFQTCGAGGVTDSFARIAVLICGVGGG